jgi:26S proteasome regulatory subunit N1
MLEAVRTVEHKRGKYACIVLETCAYAGTGNVLKIQELLRLCAEHITDPVEAGHQAAAVLGIALIALGEEIGTDMCLRTFDHLLHYGELPVKRVVPLAMALLYVSNPESVVVDQLSRLSHDADQEVAMNAIFAMGLVTAGTNNSRVSGMFRQLSEFYADKNDVLFVVRIAQGLLSMAKGLVTLNPFHSDRFLMVGPSTAGLLIVLTCFLDIKKTLLDKYHYLLYFIAPALNPRFMTTVAEDLSSTPLSVRVGQAVETVGQAGRPKTISGFQTHTTPVLLGYKDRAEFAGSDYLTKTSILEGVVLVEKVPDEEDKEE